MSFQPVNFNRGDYAYTEGQNLWGYGASQPPTLKICDSAEQKQQYNVVLHGNLLDPEPFDQILLLKKRKKSQKIFAEQNL